jgi:hypothetical protein
MRFASRPQQTSPERPSTFGQDPSQRTEEPELDYPDTDAPPDSPQDYGPHEELPERAVPVYQVEPPPGDLTFHEWSPGSGGVTAGHAIQVASQDRRRTRLIVRNLSDSITVFAVKESTSASFTGFAIPPESSEEFNSNSAVWICVDATEAGTAEISWFTEFDVDDVDED